MEFNELVNDYVEICGYNRIDAIECAREVWSKDPLGVKQKLLKDLIADEYKYISDMKKQIKGTFDQIVDKVPTKAISMMVSQNRDLEYVFTVDIQNGYLLVW